jgi:hypothetical protein
MEWHGVVEEELCHLMWLVQIAMRMVIRMGHQALIQNSMETDISLIGQ